MVAVNSKIPFEDFYSKYYDQVYWYIFKKINHVQRAQDMAGDIFCICYKKYEDYDPGKGALGTWLYTIVNNKLKNFYRDRKNNVSMDAVPDIFGDDDIEPMEKTVYVEQAREIVAEAISSLPEREQLVMVLKFFGSKQSDEIARILNMSPVNARVIVSRSLKKVQAYMLSKGWGKEV